MRRKTLLLFILIIVFLAFSACSNNDSSNNSNENNNSANNASENTNNNNSDSSENNTSDNSNNNSHQENTNGDLVDDEDEPNDANNNEPNTNISLLTYDNVYTDSNLQGTYDYYIENIDAFTIDEKKAFFSSILDEVVTRDHSYFITFDEIEDLYANPYYGAIEIGKDTDNYKNIFDFSTQTLYIANMNSEIQDSISQILEDDIFQVYKAYYMGTGYYELLGFSAVITYDFVKFANAQADELGINIPSFNEAATQVLAASATTFEYDYTYGSYSKIIIETADNVNLLPFEDKNEVFLEINVSQDQMPKSSENDYTLGYEVQADINGNLSIIYKNTGVSEVVLSKDSDGITDILNVNKSYLGDFVLFEVPTYATSNTIYKYSMVSGEVSEVANGSIVKILSDNTLIVASSYIDDNYGRIPEYQNLSLDGVIISSLTSYLDEDNLDSQLSDSWGKSLFSNEEYNDEFIDYTRNNTVLLPFYDGINDIYMNEKTIALSYENVVLLSFAVYGEITDVQIKYSPQAMNQEYQITMVDDIKNSNVTIQTQMPTDFSVVIVEYNTVNKFGETVHDSFALDDMRDLTEYVALTY